jgi:hypothetical protein
MTDTRFLKAIETTGYAQDPDEKRPAKATGEWDMVWAKTEWLNSQQRIHGAKPMNQLHLDEALTRLQAHAQWLGRPVGSTDGDESYAYPKALMIDDIGVVLQALNRQPEVVEG